MKLHEAIKHLKPHPIPKTQAEYDALLDSAARSITGHGPGHPDYEAIVNPPKRGRRAAGATKPMQQIAVRLPVALVRALQRHARTDRLTVSDEVRLAVTAFAAKRARSA